MFSTLTLTGNRQTDRGMGTPFSMLSIGDRVANDVLKEDLSTMNLLVDKPGDTPRRARRRIAGFKLVMPEGGSYPAECYHEESRSGAFRNPKDDKRTHYYLLTRPDNVEFVW